MADTVKVFSEIENPFELTLPRKRGQFKFARGEHSYPADDLKWARKQPQIKQLFVAVLLKEVAPTPARSSRAAGASS